MDPLTQGVVGLSASQLVARRSQVAAAAVLGFLSGMAADLDVLIRSSDDPLLALEYHRHFTHALIFIPLGALICALVLSKVLIWVRRKWFIEQDLSFKQIYLYCLAGYASHAVLDACTTYGTQLLWPFSDARIAWNNVSVVDPLFTLPLILLVSWVVLRRSRGMAILAAVFAFTYLGLGVLQQQRAHAIAQELAESRGHQAISLGVKPSFANIIVWKSVYEYQGRYYVDAIRVWGEPKLYPGSSIAKLDLQINFLWLDPASQQAEDIERFRWFSNDHLAVDPKNANNIIDIRYSMVPNEHSGLWAISLDQSAPASAHVAYTTMRAQGDELDQAIDSLWQMIVGR